MKDLVLNTISIDNKVVSVDDFISHNEYSLDKWYCFADFVLIRFNNIVLVRDLLSLKQKLVEYNEIYVKVLSACNYYTSVFGKKFKSVTEISKFIGLDNYDDETRERLLYVFRCYITNLQFLSVYETLDNIVDDSAYLQLLVNQMELSFKESNKNVFINNYNFAKFIELFQCRPNFDFLEVFIKSDFNFEVLTNLENYMKEEDKKELADLTGTEYNYDNLTEKVYFEDFSAKEIILFKGICIFLLRLKQGMETLEFFKDFVIYSNAYPSFKYKVEDLKEANKTYLGVHYQIKKFEKYLIKLGKSKWKNK